MAETLIFQPPRRRGRLILGGLISIAALLAVFSLIQALELPPGPVSFVYFILSALMAFLVAWLAYRLYALSRSRYTLAREGLNIQWGLRIEGIPMPAILWVRLADELDRSLPLPLMRIPGAVLGTRKNSALGRVEYLASETGNLILVSTAAQIYVISPDDPHSFLDAFQQLVEMGSLASIPALSIHPTSLLRRVWQDTPARLLFLASLALSLGLAAWVVSLAPSAGEIPLGFLGPGFPRLPTSPTRLLLLPVTSTTFFLMDWLLGAIFYRQEETRILAYLLWIAAVLTPCLFLAATYLITRVG
jgi:Bacterial PH domain